MRERKQYQYYSESDWKKERRPSWLVMVWRGFVIILVFIFLLIASIFVKVELEDQETEELEMIEEMKRMS